MPKRFWVVVGITILVCIGFPNWAYGQTQPDLTLSQGPLGSLQVIRSQNDTVSVTLHNTGADTVKTQFDVTVYLSADTLLDVGDRAVGDVAIASVLIPGDSVSVKIPVRVPSLLTLGGYKWLAKVDGANLIAESNENNNVGVGNDVQVVAPPADLVLTSGPTGPAEVNLNGNYTLALDFKNQGAGPTQNAFEIAIFLSADSIRDSSDVEVGRTTVSDKVFENTSRTVQLSVVIPSSHTLGNFQWLAVIDVANVEGESQETNNLRVGNATVVVEKLADLIVSAPPSGPNGVYRRGTYAVTTQIKNQGTGTNTSDFDVVIFLSEDLIVGNGDDIRVGDAAISGVLGVDSTRAVTVQVTIPALQAYRSYQWIAVVDEVGFVSELNETNNALIGLAVSVVPSPPDLVVENVVASTPVERSHVYDVRLDVVNQGDGVTTGAFQISLWLSVDDSIGNADDVRVGNTTVTDILNSGDRKAVAFSMTIPSQQAIGTYRLVAIADASNIETETNETNNTVFASVPVDVVPSPPDLIFVTDPAGKERVFRGVVDTVMVQIRNQGVGDVSGAFDVFVFLSVDGVADSSDVQVGALRIEQAILAGQTIDVAIPIVVASEQALGSYRWWARLDANRALNESDETNNDRVGVAVSVVNFPPDMTIFDEIITPSLVARGGVYQVSVPVRNVGTGPATLGFQVEIYLSEDERLDMAVDILAGGRKLSESFPAGAEQTVLVSVSVPLEVPVATYRWIARVAVVGLQDESDATNNIRPGNPVSFPVMTVEPAALNFGVVRVGTSESLTFEVLNGGTARLSF
ncbi:MAG: CARDB domain-containing protein, partial [Candidatus Latescibacterota bacterium]